MAHIETRTLSDGSKAYRVIWTDPAGKRRRRQFSRAQTSRPAEEARKFRAEVESELLRGTYIDPRAGDVTVAEYVSDTRSNFAGWRQSTSDRADWALNLHILPLIGSYKIGGVRRRDIQEMVNKLAATPSAHRRGSGPPRPLAPSTVRGIYLLVASVFRSATLDGVIRVSPCTRIKLPAMTDGDIVIPTPEQVGMLADGVPVRYRGLVLAAAGSGLRLAELCALDLERLRVLERTVRVDRQLCFGKGGQHYYGPPKTAAAYRTVPLADVFVQDIAEHLERFGTGDDGLVFTSSTGRPLRRQTLGGVLRPVLAELGFPTGTGLHLLRHYYVSGLIAHGVDLRTVMDLVGHDSPQETLGTYGHLWPGHEERSREAGSASHPTRAPKRTPGTVTRLDDAR